jgi:TrpR-related protein YerC/YecD
LHPTLNQLILRPNVLTRYYISTIMKQHNERQLKALEVAAESLCNAFLTLEKPAEVRQFLLDLCTPSELEAIVDRWWTASLLREGRSYRDISEVTGVSVTTIGRVARYMNMGEGGYRLALRREEASKS